jgi:hypothetical protein
MAKPIVVGIDETHLVAVAVLIDTIAGDLGGERVGVGIAIVAIDVGARRRTRRPAASAQARRRLVTLGQRRRADGRVAVIVAVDVPGRRRRGERIAIAALIDGVAQLGRAAVDLGVRVVAVGAARPQRRRRLTISVSVDPTVDTPERLQDFAKKFKAEPGWAFVTGDKAEIDALLQALGVAITNKNDHTPMVLIGNEVADHWTRTYGLSSPKTIVDLIEAASPRK